MGSLYEFWWGWFVQCEVVNEGKHLIFNCGGNNKKSAIILYKTDPLATEVQSRKGEYFNNKKGSQ